MSRRYGIKGVFDTIQGEGARAGQRSVFVRFTGCNLWDGHPLHRDQGAGPCARWCDTDFMKGNVLELDALLDAMDKEWEQTPEGRWCVLTGGEPAMQIDMALVEALHERDWAIAVETNGTIDSDAVRACEHVCLSPKRGTDWRKLGFAHEVKVVLPGAQEAQGWTDEELLSMQETVDGWGRDVIVSLFVQPQDPIVAPNLVEATLLKGHAREAPEEHEALLRAVYAAYLARCLSWVKAHPEWRLSAQLHKFLGLE